MGSLLEFSDMMSAHSMFLPHGICAHVHLGGHLQTGGYGQSCRAHGLLCDYVEGIELVTADGMLKRLSRPQKGKRNPKNDDLFWAVLGGSPGNYGVLTHVLLKPLHDKDYPDSRGMKLMSLYSRKKLELILTLVSKMSDDDGIARDFDL